MNDMSISTCQPILFIRQGEVFCNSQNVADTFEKQHSHVLRAIDNLIKAEEEIGIHQFSEEDRLPKFGETVIERQNPSGGLPIKARAFDMNRDGFTLLAMGFTGAKALKWKLLYIEAFNAMEAELRAIQTPTRPRLPSSASHDLRPEEVVAWSSAARCVERIHGRRAAAKFWTQTPLPQVTEGDDFDVDPMDTMAARDCLKHLFRICSSPHEAVGDLYRKALTDSAARNRLEKCGLMLGLRDWPDDLVVAANHPFLADAFELTDFAWAWCSALILLPGARRVSQRVLIDEKLTPGVAIPKDYLARNSFPSWRKGGRRKKRYLPAA
jgi:Rha family phage regulatory protein